MRGKSARELDETETRDMAVRYLCRREYGTEELRQKLLYRGCDSAMAEKVVGDLVDENLVSDERFTEMYVRTRASRLFGPLKIRAELRSRGISDFLISKFLPAEQEAWFDAASEWATKRCSGELDYASRAKIYRSLVNRGFTHEQANVALDSIRPA
jgi:regulatory protein